MKTKKEGISLIVLVITVIVLGILATVVIVNISNNNIITEAENAVENYNNKQMMQAMQLDEINNYVSNKGNSSLNFFEKIEVSKNKGTITEEFANKLIKTGGRVGTGTNFMDMDTSSVLRLEPNVPDESNNSIRMKIKVKKIPNFEITSVGLLVVAEVSANSKFPEISIEEKFVKNAKEIYGLNSRETIINNPGKETDEEYVFYSRLDNISESNADYTVLIRGYVEYTYNGISGIMYSNIIGTSLNEYLAEQ